MKYIDKVVDFLKKIWDRFWKLDRKKRLYVAALFFIVFIMAWAFISAGVITCNFNRAQIKGKQDEQKVDALGIIITETKEGKKYFEIYGENGHYDNNDHVAILNSVIGNFYKDNEVAMSFQSSKGSYTEETGTINLYEHTYIVLKDNTSLEADKLTWSGSDKETIAEGHVKIKKGNEMYATADKCIIGAEYKSFKIVGKTQTKIYSNKES